METKSGDVTPLLERAGTFYFLFQNPCNLCILVYQLQLRPGIHSGSGDYVVLGPTHLKEL